VADAELTLTDCKLALSLSAAKAEVASDPSHSAAFNDGQRERAAPWSHPTLRFLIMWGCRKPQPTEWQRIGNQIDATMILARADFVNVF